MTGVDIAVFTATAAGLVRALTEAAKKAGLPDRLSPVFEIVLGELLVVGAVLTGATSIAGFAGAAAIYFGLLYGAFAGLAAGGLYALGSAVKPTPE